MNAGPGRVAVAWMVVLPALLSVALGQPNGAVAPEGAAASAAHEFPVTGSGERWSVGTATPRIADLVAHGQLDAAALVAAERELLAAYGGDDVPVGARPASHPAAPERFEGPSWGTLRTGLAAGDISGDGLDDALVLERDAPGGAIRLLGLRGTDGVVLWSLTLDALEVIPLPVGDVTGDGVGDVLLLEFHLDDVRCPLVIRCRVDVDASHAEFTHRWVVGLWDSVGQGFAWRRTFSGETRSVAVPTGQIATSSSALVLPFLNDVADPDGTQGIALNVLDLHVVEVAGESATSTATRAGVLEAGSGNLRFAREAATRPGEALLVPVGEAVGGPGGDWLWHTLTTLGQEACSAVACHPVGRALLTMEAIDGVQASTAWSVGFSGPAGSPLDCQTEGEPCRVVCDVLADNSPRDCGSVSFDGEIGDREDLVDAEVFALPDVTSDGATDIMIMERLGTSAPVSRQTVLSGADGAIVWRHVGPRGPPLVVGPVGPRSSDLGLRLGLEPFGLEADLRYWDVDATGSMGRQDVPYLSPDGLVTTNDLRAGVLGTLPYGALVGATDIDFVASLSGPMADAALCFQDDDADQAFDPGETVYVDIDGDGSGGCGPIVEANDLRLTPFGSHPAGTKVRSADDDFGGPLVGLGEGSPSSPELDAYDADANLAFNAGDSLYVNVDGDDDQVTLDDVRLTPFGPRPAGSWVVLGDPDVGLALADDAFAFPGDFRSLDLNNDGAFNGNDDAYLSSKSMAAPNAVRLGSSFGSTVRAGDSDASAVFEPLDQPAFCFVDDSGNGAYDPGESVYLDASASGVGLCGADVATNDLRLTPSGSNAAGTQVRTSDDDFNRPLSDFATGPELDALDADGNSFLNAGDAIYLNVDGADNQASVGDVRMTPFGSKAAGTWVSSGDPDEAMVLTASGLGLTGGQYWDLNGDRHYNAGDVAYMASGAVATVNDLRLGSIGALRYGALVGASDADAAAFLTDLAANAAFCAAQEDMDGAYDVGEAIYLAQGGSAPGSCPAGPRPGDLRVTPNLGFAAGFLVQPGDLDVGSVSYAPLRFGTAHPAIMAYDADADGRFGVGDPLYVNVNSTDGLVSVGDVRLTANSENPAGSVVMALAFGFVAPRIEQLDQDTAQAVVERFHGRNGESLFETRYDVSLPPGATLAMDAEVIADADGDAVDEVLVTLVTSSSQGVLESRTIVESGLSGVVIYDRSFGGTVLALAAGDADADGAGDLLELRLRLLAGTTDAELSAIRLPSGEELWRRVDSFRGGPDRAVLSLARTRDQSGLGGDDVLYSRGQIATTSLLFSRTDGVEAASGVLPWGYGFGLVPPGPAYHALLVPPTSLQTVGWTRVPLGDEASQAFAIPPTPFFGVTVTTMTVSSNGFVAFGPYAGNAACCGPALVPLPDAADGIVAGLWADLDPGACPDGGIFVKVASDKVRVAFDRVPYYGAPCATALAPLAEPTRRVSFVLTVEPATGIVEVHLVRVDGGVVGTTGLEAPDGLDGAMPRRSEEPLTSPIAWRFRPT